MESVYVSVYVSNRLDDRLDTAIGVAACGKDSPRRRGPCHHVTCMRHALIEKLRPDRFTAMSGKMAAVVGYILDERFTDPAISELVVTSDGFVLAQSEGEVGANDLIGSEADLNRNLLDLITAAGLSDDEAREFGRLQRERISRYSHRRG